MPAISRYVLIALLLWNITVFFVYAMDKFRAGHGGWRVSEKALLCCGFLGGGVGALCGMTLLRHKTRHLRFRLLLPVAAVLTVLLAFIAYQPEAVAAAARALLKTATGEGA